MPLYNFHQSLGQPNFSNGWSSALNPLSYLAVSLSYLFLGNEFGSVDILVIMNSIIGGIGFFYFLKKIKLSNLAAFLGATTLPLSSFSMYVSDSWWWLSAITAFFPWILFLSIRLLESYGFDRLAFLGITFFLSLAFFAGHPQFFAYIVIFEGIFVCGFIILSHLIQKKVPGKNILFWLASHALFALLSLPLLLPMIRETALSVRTEALPFYTSLYDPFLMALGFVFPFTNDLKMAIRTDWTHQENLSFIGYVPLLFIALGIIVQFVRPKIQHRFTKKQMIVGFLSIVLVAFAYLWTTGVIGMIMLAIPMINRFTMPFKLFIFIGFFLITLSVIFFDYCYRLFGKYKKIIASVFILLNLSTFLYLYCYYGPQVFGGAAPEKPPFKETLSGLTDGRIISIGSANDRMTTKTLASNYASLFGLYHLGGYDPLTPMKNLKNTFGWTYLYPYNTEGSIPITHLRDWGVKYYVVLSNNANSRSVERYKKELSENGILPQIIEKDRTVYSDNKTKPLFFWEKTGKSDGIKYKIKSNSIWLETNNQENDNLIINFIYNPDFQFVLDSNQKLPVAENGSEQISVRIRPGKHQGVLKYVDPNYQKGLIIAGATLLLLLVVLLWLPLRGKRKIK